MRLERAVETEVRPRKNTSEIPLNAFNLRMPRGIDHEVPRWSAAYSMFTEVLKLIPPEEYSPTQQDDATSSEEENNQQGRTDSDRIRSDQPVSSESKEQDTMVDSSTATDESCGLHSPERTRSSHISPLDKEFHLSSSKHFHEGFTMYDMDALLRF
ncbi:uncharacterized protein N7469_005663 [Penicillium citrinum]|uniref:Uncharacterized protein n=1 Tax=Penicillium citrinum TaxID=5077 RepID=A0A9W9P203_PENCI|nr:uncharacterized protein N7469_005663 [Penicillium citrinum]KAJ5233897.1 hypothetical protein N7469_005663 [Penicillium citrinum]